MRIGLLTTSFPRWEGDVPGTFVLGFARALARRGHTLEVLAPEPAEPVAPPAWPAIDVHFLPYIRPRSAARTFYGAGVPDNLRSDPRALLGLAPFCASMLHATFHLRHGWDAVVSHFALPCGLIAGLLREHRPHLCVVHSADAHLLHHMPGRSALAHQLARGSSALMFVTATHRDRFLTTLPPQARATIASHTHVQPMGVHPPTAPSQPRNELRSALGLSRFTLLTIARLVPVKGLIHAVDALAHRADLEWLIAGDGPEAEALRTRAARTQLRVRLLGTVHGQAKQDLFHAADAFLLPSRLLPSGRSEGVPGALLEAMTSGLPAIATDVGGIRELITHDHTGLLYSPTEPTQLETCIDRLRLDPALRAQLTEAATRHASRYTWDHIAPRIEALLHD